MKEVQMVNEETEEEVIIGFKASKEMKRRLKIEAARTGKTVREIMEQLVKEHLEKAKRDNPYRIDED
jgi:hypothetical protein